MVKEVILAFTLLSTSTSTLALSKTLTTDQLAAQRTESRAVEAVIWGMPAVNTDLMRQATAKAFGSQENRIVFWSRLPNWKSQTLTPNPDAVYLMAFFNTKDGPMVLDVPPASSEGSITGNIDNLWQVALEDAGPSGADKGKGGKFLILPPGYKDPVPDGYIPLQSTNFGGYALLRSILTGGSDADIAKAVAYGKRGKLYPLAQAANPPETRFADAVDTVFDSTIPYDLRFFESLNRVVQQEPWLDRDRAMIDPLKSIGIEKGKPFAPDAKTKKLLERAAHEAKAWLEMKYETSFVPYNEGRHWAVPASPAVIEGQATDYAKPDSYPTDARGLTYSYGFVGIKHFGTGQFYLMTIKDKAGQAFDGAATYRLTVPKNAPVSQYWSATVYNRATHAFIREQTRFSRSSQNPDLKANADGSIDIYFGPKAPKGVDANWIPTDPNGQFEVLFRLYGPQKPLFDKVWVLPDIEKIKGRS